MSYPPPDPELSRDPYVVDLGGPAGGRYWRVTTPGTDASHEDARSAAIYARVTGSVGCTYNAVTVERA